MSLPARTLLIAAALSLLSTAGIARDIPGGPAAMIGTYAENREQCSVYFNEGGEDAHHFYGDSGKYYLTKCGGKYCRAQVLSYRVTPAGFVLDLKHIFAYEGFRQKLSIARMGRNSFRFHFAGGEPFNAVRCSREPFHRAR